eukprot:CAMPEP_0171789300 /NCGR_PEP_ID=MMETSP0991-20121206/65021_1 /TAXON_ID=483369 /ORGANISM="non described non described, Strain CCMP2098" /LENGTH=131 /DNA_ID=CAMNT_0012398631 /DNA_START=165 /DNA_END=557 /DNA_ORIENTATION=+
MCTILVEDAPPHPLPLTPLLWGEPPRATTSTHHLSKSLTPQALVSFKDISSLLVDASPAAGFTINSPVPSAHAAVGLSGELILHLGRFQVPVPEEVERPFPFLRVQRRDFALREPGFHKLAQWMGRHKRRS